MEPKDMLYTMRGVLHMHWEIIGTNDTPLNSWTKIIQPMVFTKYPHEGTAFLLGFGMAMQYLFRFQYICYGTQRIFYVP